MKNRTCFLCRLQSRITLGLAVGILVGLKIMLALIEIISLFNWA